MPKTVKPVKDWDKDHIEVKFSGPEAAALARKLIDPKLEEPGDKQLVDTALYKISSGLSKRGGQA